MPSLRHTEAIRRAERISVQHTEIWLDLREDDRFISRSRIEFTCRVPGGDTFLDVAAAEMRSATLNGEAVDASLWSDGRLRLTGLAGHNVVDVVSVMTYSHDAEGLHRSVDPIDGQPYLFAMSFLDAAPRWFACFDQPDLKSTYRLHVQASLGWEVIGNGEVVQASPGEWTVDVPWRLSTYLVTVCAGPYVSVTGAAGDVPLVLYARRSLTPELGRHADEILATTAAGLRAYGDLFRQPYPFGVYRQVFVPDFNAGAMENPGCVVLRDSLLFRGTPTRAELAARAGTIIHEQAHMWFGDLVTLRWWDDLWLNESFADYLSQRITSDVTPYDRWTSFGIRDKAHAIEADQLPSSHPVAGNGARDAAEALGALDPISYAKGAALLRQLAARLGDDVFFAGLNDYIDAHREGNATMADLLDAWENAGAGPLTDWAAAWLETRGVDLLRADELEVQRLNPREQPARRDHAIEVVALDALGAETGRNRLTVGSLPQPHELVGTCVVPDAGDATWATVRPSVAWRDMPTIAEIADPATRVVCYAGLADAVRHVEVSAADALTILLRSLPVETDDIILGAVLTWVRELVDVWLPPAERERGRGRVLDLVRGLLVEADPASERQLIAWRTLLECDADPAELRDFLAGERIPVDAPFDEPLRWLAASRIAYLTGDMDTVEAQERRDPTDAGRRAAARARAAVPTLQARQDALDALLTSADGPQFLVAVGEGLSAAAPTDVQQEAALAWIDALPDLCERHRGWAQRMMLRASFPMRAAHPDVVARLEREVAAGILPGSACRTLTDLVDTLSRAQQSQQQFGAVQ